MSNILERLGVNVTGEQFRPKNVAAVFVTASLPAFSRVGSQIDVTVSAIGDAKSLLGGTLIMTPLNAADGQIYAVAQGSVIAGGGASAEGNAGGVVQGVPTAGAILQAHGLNARSRLNCRRWNHCASPCGSQTSPQRRESSGKSTAILVEKWRLC